MHFTWIFNCKPGRIWLPNKYFKSCSYGHLSKIKQRVKVNETFRFWKDIEYGVPWRSVIGPLLFSIHLRDFWLENLDIASYADDTTIFAVQENKDFVINTLEALSLPLFTWFNINFIKVKSDENHLSLNCGEPSTALIDGTYFESNTKEILLEITNVRDMKFNDISIISKNLILLFALHLSWTLIKKKNSNERFYRIAIWILPISLDVP